MNLLNQCQILNVRSSPKKIYYFGKATIFGSAPSNTFYKLKTKNYKQNTNGVVHLTFSIV